MGKRAGGSEGSGCTHVDEAAPAEEGGTGAPAENKMGDEAPLRDCTRRPARKKERAHPMQHQAVTLGAAQERLPL